MQTVKWRMFPGILLWHELLAKRQVEKWTLISETLVSDVWARFFISRGANLVVFSRHNKFAMERGIKYLLGGFIIS
jgi:hypothetical protein